VEEKEQVMHEDQPIAVFCVFHIEEGLRGKASFKLVGVAANQRIAQDIASAHAESRHMQADVFVGTRLEWSMAGNYIAEPTVVRQQQPDAKRVTFKDDSDDGEGPWTVLVDGEVVIDELRSDHMDLSHSALEPLWKALGAVVEFEQVYKDEHVYKGNG
jgi:hypothetical protein